MAIVKYDGEKRKVTDGEQILFACEELGVQFGCQEGECGTCLTIVLAGLENLGPKNEKEEALTSEENERLACQCRITGGTVELSD